MANYDDIIEAIQGANRRFGREDLSGSDSKLTTDLFTSLEESIDSLDNTIQSIDDRLNRGVASNDVRNALNQLRDELRRNRDEAINKRDNYTNNDSAKTLRRAGLERLSGNSGYKVFNKGVSIKQTGEAISKLGKGFKGLGGVVAETGKTISNHAGKLGLAIKGLELAFESLHSFWKQGIEIENKERKYGAQDISAQYKIMSTKFQGVAQMKQQDMQVAQTTLSAMSSAASSAQSAMGAFAQEAVGIHAQLATEGKKIVYDAYATSHEIASELPFNIKEGAYKAAEAAVSTASQVQNYNTTDKYSGKSLSIAAAKMENAISSAYGQAAAQIEGANTVAAINKASIKEITGRNVESQELQRQAQLTDANYDIKRSEDIKNGGVLAGPVVKWWKETFSDVKQSAVSSKAHYKADTKTAQNQHLNEITQSISSIQAGNAQMAAQAKATNIQLAASARDINLSIQKQQVDMKKNIESAANEAAKKIQMAWLKMTEKLNDTFLKHQQAASIMGREMGMTGDKLQSYTEKMGQYQVEVSKWGKDLEWMQKFQGAYQETSGRNVEMSQRDFETSAALGLNVGDETVAQYVGGMEIFNHSVEDSNEKLYTMFKEVSKIGLNGKKYAKELASNLKLAEKFNFKGGVDSLMRMSKWAQNMRFNVASMDGMLDKVQEGGLEGVIQQSAELQVLGGNFAMGSDPLAMAYESYMDPEAYAKRMNGMLAGQGVFDSKSGEVSFGIASQQMMRQYAKSTGQDYKDVLNQARAQVKLGQIGKTLNGDFTDDQKSLIANKAQYDTETGKWQVQVGNEKKEVSSLTKEDIEALTPADPTEIQQNMLDEIKGLRSIQEKYLGQQQENMATLEASVWGPLRDSNERIIQSVGETFSRDFETYRNEAINNMQIIEKSQGDWIKQFEQGNADVDAKRQELINAIDNLNASIQGVNQKADSHIAGAMSQGVSAMGVSAPYVDTSDLEAMKENAETMPETDVKHEKEFDWGLIADGAAAGGLVGLAVGGAETAGLSALAGAAIGAVSGAAVACFDYYVPDTWKEACSDSWNEFTTWCGEGMDSFAKWGNETWSSVCNTANNAWNGITKFAGNTWQSFMKTDIGKGLSTVYNDISKGVTTVVGDIKIGWDNVKEKAIAIWTPIGEKFTQISDYVSGKWTQFSDYVGGKWTQFSDYVGGKWTQFSEKALAIWGEIKNVACTAASAMWDGVKTVACGAASAMWDGVTTMASRAWDGIKNIAGGFWESLKGLFTLNFKRVWEGLKEGVEGVVKLISSPFAGLAKTIGEVVDGVRGFTGRLITSMAEGFGKLVSGGWDMLKSWVKGVISDGTISQSGVASKINDGLVIQNGRITRIDNNDQVLAAKTGGPVDRMLDTIHSMSSVLPRPMSYDSYVKENPYSNGGAYNNGKLEIAPIQININGNIQLNGESGMIDISQQISKDPNFIRALTQMISAEVQKSVNGGRVTDVFNRGF